MNKLTFLLVLAGAWTASCGGGGADKATAANPLSDSIALHQGKSVGEVRKQAPAEASETASTPSASPKIADADEAARRALLDAYPDFISAIDGNKVAFTDGSTMVFDDGRKKSFETMLDDSDIQDMFFTVYQSEKLPPEYLADAGRSRNEALFKKMYGASAGAVQKNLVTVPWFGENIRFTKVNGAADRLKEVAAELAKYPELKKYMKCSGTFYWRKVRGANRQSAHSYGIAVDIAVPNSDYWLWKNPGASETAKIKYANRIPRQIVEIFEKHGFVWGGAWYHFDTMHFEYRPEIINYAKLKANK